MIIGNDRFPPCAKYGESPPTQAADGKCCQQSPIIHIESDNNCSGVNTDDTVCGQAQMCPLYYAVPDKLKSKVKGLWEHLIANQILKLHVSKQRKLVMCKDYRRKGYTYSALI